jgi:hypothetical protein
MASLLGGGMFDDGGVIIRDVPGVFSSAGPE